MCDQTMVVVGNRYMINVRVVGDKYWWSVIGIYTDSVHSTLSLNELLHITQEFYRNKNDGENRKMIGLP